MTTITHSDLAVPSSSASSASRPLCANKRRGFTALSVGLLALGILGVCYGVTMMTPLATRYSTFFPLGSMGTKGVLVISLPCGAVSLAGGGCIICLHVPRKLELQELLKELSRNQSSKNPIFKDKKSLETLKKVKDFINSGFDKYLDHYEFYANLSTLTAKVIAEKNEHNKSIWQAFLTKIHGMPVVRTDGGQVTHIDCRLALAKLNQALPPKVEMEVLKTPVSEKDFKAIIHILSEAFHNFPIQSKSNLETYLVGESGTPYVIRNSQTKEIYAIVVVQKKATNELYFHSLARRADAVGLKLADIFIQHMKTQASTIKCGVLEENKPAQCVYTKLGFIKETEEVQVNQAGKTYYPLICKVTA